MSEQQGTPFEVNGEDAQEARVVAWVLGEASEFEIGELRRLCEEQPELEIFRRRIAAVHGLAGDGLKKPQTDWKLPPVKRRKVLSELGARADEVRRERSSRFAARRVLLAVAACLGLTVIVAALVFPLFFGARAWKKASPEAEAAMERRNAAAEAQFYGDKLADGDGDEFGWKNEEMPGLRGESEGRSVDFESRNTGTELRRRKVATNRPVAPATPPMPAKPPATRAPRASVVAAPTTAPTAVPVPVDAPEDLKGRPIVLNGSGTMADFTHSAKPGDFGSGDDFGSGGGSGSGGPGTGQAPLLGDVPTMGRLFRKDAVANRMEPTENGGRPDRSANESMNLGSDEGDSFSADPFAAAGPAGPAPDPEPTPPRTTATSGKTPPVEVEGLGLSPDAAAKPAGNVTKAQRDLRVADGRVERGDLDAAKRDYEDVLKVDPYNKEARRGLERVASATSSYYRAAYDETRAKLLAEVDAAWEMEATDHGESVKGGQAIDRFAGDGIVDKEAKLLVKERESKEEQQELAETTGTPHLALGVDADAARTTRDWHMAGGTVSGGSTMNLALPGEKNAKPESAVARLSESLARHDERPAAEESYESRSFEVGGELIERLSQLDTNGEAGLLLQNGGQLDLTTLSTQDTAELLRGYGLALPEESTVTYDSKDGSLLVKAPEGVLDNVQGLIDRLPTPPGAEQAIDLMAEMSAGDEPFSTFSLHVSDASFRVAAAALARGERPDPEAVRPEEFYNAFDYGDPGPTAGEPVACAIEQCAHPLLPSRNLVRVGVRTAAAGRGAGQPLRLTILLDNSGSMEREDRRAAVQAAMGQLASLLGPQDVITVAGFARQPRLLVDRAGGAGGQEQLAGLVGRTPAEGGTNLELALQLADELATRQFEKSAQNRIVLLTDGAANLGNADPEELAKRVEGLRQRGISFDAAGFGTAGLNDRMLERLTRDGNGRYYVVDGPEDADEQFAKKLAGAFRPAAENVKVQVRFNPARVGGYRLIGFEEHRLKKEDFRDDTVDAAEMASEEAGVAVYQVELLPEGEGEIGEVSVRFRDASKGKMVERSWTMPHDESAPAFDRAPASMQIAGMAVLAADALRDGPLAPLTDWAELAPVTNQVRAEFGGSERVGELLRMVERLR